MPRTRQQIESRFRGGSAWLLIVGVLSALTSTAIYKGIGLKFLAVVSLATPLVLDTVASKLLGGWLWAEQIHYICYIISLVMAAFFGLLGLLCMYGSHTGSFFKIDRLFGPFAKIGSTFGFAHLFGARLLYFSGILLYVLDGLFAFGLESLLRNWFSELRVLVLMNLGFHCLVLVFLTHGFLAGLEREAPPPEEAE